MILSGTIASTVQLQMLNNKWMQKKESGNVLSKQELNERSTWTSEQFMIADFQDQLEHNREAEKRQKIDNKIARKLIMLNLLTLPKIHRIKQIM